MGRILKMAGAVSQSAPLQFYKYSVCGNHFVLVDETQGCCLAEADKSAFACRAGDEHFGIGCDSILFLQNYSPELLQSIGPVKQLCGDCRPDQPADIDFIFRVFEPSGRESMCCGNGLLSVAHLLHRLHGIKAARILTEVPSLHPRVREVRARQANGACCVNMGPPCNLPAAFIQKDVMQCVKGALSVIHNLQVAFQVKAMDGSLQNFQLPLQGFLTYTGEPHLVIVDNHRNLLSKDDEVRHHVNSHHPLVTVGFCAQAGANGGQQTVQLEMGAVVKAILDDHRECARENPSSIYSVRLLRQIGLCLNTDDSPLFPEGININFARVLDARQGIVEYRCFERGNRKETLACGTGAIAIAAAASQFNLVETDCLRLWPKSARHRDPHMELRTNKDADGNWWLEGNPRLLFSGSTHFFLGDQPWP